jgi:type II secretory pathway pseudopilin PulG
MRQTRAFTLIELLVIIAILAAILFPVFAKAREKARQSQCMSNLKNCALALRMYSSDFDEKLPFGVPTIGGVFGWPNSAPDTRRCRWEYSCGWAFQSQAYIKNNQVLVCPNWNRTTFAGPAAGSTQDWYMTTYELSSSLVGAAESEINNAANKAMLYEILPYHHDSTILSSTAAGCPANTHTVYCNNPKPGMSVIVGFADGHTTILNLNTALGPTTACGVNSTGANGTPGAGINANNITRGAANKWNLNAGWESGSAPNFTCTAAINTSPFGTTGRQGSNF